MSANERRYFELVELARICWRNSQTAGTQQVALTLRRMATEYLQEAAKLDDGNVPDIGLVDNNESGWVDARRKQPARGQRVLALLPMDDEGYEVDAGQRPYAWVVAQWDGLRWGILDAAGNWRGPEYISWWCEIPEAPEGVIIVP
jgi:hypothetical protein